MKTQTPLTRRCGPVDPKILEQNQKTLRAFIEVYCRHNHGMPKGLLCEECRDLLDYAHTRVAKCPYDPKPKCKDCPTHCYKPSYRQKIKEVMRFSGMHFIKRGRIDWLFKYFFMKAA